jgi:hypoxanthine phosphoribosyltransferase
MGNYSRSTSTFEYCFDVLLAFGGGGLEIVELFAQALDIGLELLYLRLQLLLHLGNRR